MPLWNSSFWMACSSSSSKRHSRFTAQTERRHIGCAAFSTPSSLVKSSAHSAAIFARIASVVALEPCTKSVTDFASASESALLTTNIANLTAAQRSTLAARGITGQPYANFPSNQTVRVEPGCLWGEVDKAANPYGLAVPSGFCACSRIELGTVKAGISTIGYSPNAAPTSIPAM